MYQTRHEVATVFALLLYLFLPSLRKIPESPAKSGFRLSSRLHGLARLSGQSTKASFFSPFPLYHGLPARDTTARMAVVLQES